jgi:AsmA protein
LIFLLIVLGLLLWRPGADFLRARITESIARGLGRPVEIGNVSLQILPRPGFQLSPFVVYDDPRFSHEPMLRSDEVTALLHLSSIWRRRIEIAQLSLKEPSLNLVLGDNGRWNIEGLLERAAQTPAAPTAKATSEARPRFPYIEADQGRINFRVGLEKKAYALIAADFALWLESENEWGMRLKARPVRVDMSSSDTGMLRINGSWKRAPTLGEIPLQITASLEGAQLGQFTKLLLGQDKGWRGTLGLSATFNGKLEDAAITSDMTIQDFRRYDIYAGPALVLSAHCEAQYRRVGLADIACKAPLGAGNLQLAGNLQGPSALWQHELRLTATDVAAQTLVDVARRAKKDLPEDLTASGAVNADLAFRKDASDTLWSGEGTVSELVLGSKTMGGELAIESVPFRLASPGRKGLARVGKPLAAPAGNFLGVGPFAVAAGKGEANAYVWFTRHGYGHSFAGEMPLLELLQLSRLAGIGAPDVAATGKARFNLATAEEWSGFPRPRLTGSMALTDVRAEFRGLNAPVILASGELVLTPTSTRLQNMKATIGTSRWSGSVVVPSGCTDCPIEVDLQADTLSSQELNRLLTSVPGNRPWYRILTPSQVSDSQVSRLNVRGRLSAAQLSLHGLIATHVTAGIALDHGLLHLSDMRADVLGGKHIGNWTANWGQQPPLYSGTGTITAASLSQVSKLTHQDWVSGVAGGSYELQLTGTSSSDMRGSATGKVVFDARDGAFTHLRVSEGAPLRFHRFRGQLSLNDGIFTLREGKLDAASSIYQVSGTVPFTGKLDFQLAENPDSVRIIRGTLASPEIEHAKAQPTEAKLKK